MNEKKKSIFGDSYVYLICLRAGFCPKFLDFSTQGEKYYSVEGCFSWDEIESNIRKLGKNQNSSFYTGDFGRHLDWSR